DPYVGRRDPLAGGTGDVRGEGRALPDHRRRRWPHGHDQPAGGVGRGLEPDQLGWRPLIASVIESVAERMSSPSLRRWRPSIIPSTHSDNTRTTAPRWSNTPALTLATS